MGLLVEAAEQLHIICQSSETLNISRLFVYCDNNYYLCNKIIEQYGNKMINNPFIVGKYLSDEYFCDRIEETDFLGRGCDQECI